ncbi:MAG: SDR family NAD(P)-dependent oxidoreductase, partial [Candidatus Limnocylindria bacterium]
MVETVPQALDAAWDILRWPAGNPVAHEGPLDSRHSYRRYLSEQPVRTYGQSRPVHSSEPPRVIIVTGATSGIGRAAAVALARREWHVIASGRDAERGDAVAAEISS